MSRSIGWKRHIGSSSPAIERPSGLILTVYRTRRPDGAPKSDRLLASRRSLTPMRQARQGFSARYSALYNSPGRRSGYGTHPLVFLSELGALA